MKKEKDVIINRTSQEFPMKTFYGNINPVRQKEERPIIKLFPDLRNGFNNESPDFFRMDSMKENETSYKNPYLNVVKTLDRSLFYKNNQSCIDHINMINKVKSKKELSQNPKILKQLCYSTDINILENNLHKESKIIPYMYRTINSDFENPEYYSKVKNLNGEYGINHHYLTKNSFNMKKVNNNQMLNTSNELNNNINDIKTVITNGNINSSNTNVNINFKYTNDNIGNLNTNDNEKVWNEDHKNKNFSTEEKNNIKNINNNNINKNNSNSNTKPINFMNTFMTFNKDKIEENDMERGVEKNLNFMTMYPSGTKDSNLSGKCNLNSNGNSYMKNYEKNINICN